METGGRAAGDPDRVVGVEPGPEVETRVRGSRFIAQLLPAGSPEEARAALDAIRRRYHDATHHCWALRTGPPGEAQERFDDDGEPSGTAGAPILAALRHASVTDALCVVTRYFGGVKLGTGGLGRAYAEAARAALDATPRRVRFLTEPLDVRCDFERIGAVEAVIARAGETIESVERTFEPEPRLRLAVRRSHAEALARAIVDATSGAARVERGGSRS